MREIRICRDADEVSHIAAEHLARKAAESIASRGRFSVALSGGSTPRRLYEVLSRPPYAAGVDWEHVHLYWGDERCVPFDHPDSNYQMVRLTLLAGISIPVGNVHPIQCAGSPKRAAQLYEDEIASHIGEVPRFDLVLLGLGLDGHTASLFPGTPAVGEQRRRVVAVHVPKLQTWRVSFTLPMLNDAWGVLFLVTGGEKARVLAKVLADDDCPASRVQPIDGQLTWLVDAEAAACLPLSGGTGA